MSDIPAALRDEVVLRAGNRCEYCGLAQAGQEAAFHIDHVIPRAAAGPTEVGNLALACVSCSLRKWARRSAPDPETGADAPLFSPRTHRWADHFRWDGAVVVPLSRTNAGHAGADLGMIRRVAVSLLRRAGKKGTAHTRRLRAGWDDQYVAQVIRGLPTHSA